MTSKFDNCCKMLHNPQSIYTQIEEVRSKVYIYCFQDIILLFLGHMGEGFEILLRISINTL